MVRSGVVAGTRGGGVQHSRHSVEDGSDREVEDEPLAVVVVGLEEDDHPDNKGATDDCQHGRCDSTVDDTITLLCCKLSRSRGSMGDPGG